MKSLLLHPVTEYHFNSLLQSKPHALMIVGQTGTGKQSLAKDYARQILGPKPYMLEILPQNGAIGIDAIRSIKDFLKRKTAGTGQRRAVIIYDAHNLSVEAQNALLKTLEEPPEDTVIVMTVNDAGALKPTIRSRTQQLSVLPASLETALKHFESAGFGSAETEKAYHMSQGRAGLLASLLTESDEHELVQAISDAKALMGMSAYERLLQVDTLSKDKVKTSLLLEGLERISTSGMRRAAEKNQVSTVKKFYGLSQQIMHAKKALSENVNAKLVLTDLLLNM